MESDETQSIEEGPIKIIDVEKVPKNPRALPESYEWVTMDLTDEKEVYTPVNGRFVYQV